MRTLKFPEDLDSFAAIATGLPQESQLTVEETKTLANLFKAYDDFGGRTDLIAEDAVFNKSKRAEELRTAYGKTKTAGKLSYIRTKLIKLAKNRCPCCGGARPGQLDHHLPKDAYAEYSLWLKNLVPYCVGCNQKKSNNFGKTEETAFLHPYFDPIPNTSYIKAAVAIEENNVAVTLFFDDDADIADVMLKARMKYQFDKVDVNARIEDEITEYIGEHCDNIDDEYETASPDDVRDYLNRNAKRIARRHGKGSWRSTVLLSLAASDDFCSGGYKLMVQ